MSRNVVGDVQMTNNPSKAHVGGASEADVSAADVELAAMNAKPSNVIPGMIIVCLAISLGCSVGASATDEWAVSMGSHYGTLCAHSLVRPHAGVHWPALQKFATAGVRAASFVSTPLTLLPLPPSLASLSSAHRTCTGLFQKCSVTQSSDSDVTPLKICYKQTQAVDPADPIEVPYRVRICQRYGAADSDKPWEVTYREETGDGWGKPSVTCDLKSPDEAKAIADSPTPTPAPTVEGATLGAGYTNKGNSTSRVQRPAPRALQRSSAQS